MKTFHSEENLKESLIAFTKKGIENGLYKRGYWLHKEVAYEDLQCGCFYGGMTQCEEEPLSKANIQYGLPLWYVHVTERIYEGLPENEWKTFPLEAIEILPVGIDTNKIQSLFQYKLLENQLQFCNGNTEVEKAIKKCMELFKVPFNEIDESAAESARYAARSAAMSAAMSAESASESAEYYESDAWSASESAAKSALFAAWSASESAAKSALFAAWSADMSAKSAVWFAAASAAGSDVEYSQSNYYSFIKNLLFQCVKELYREKEVLFINVVNKKFVNV